MRDTRPFPSKAVAILLLLSACNSGSSTRSADAGGRSDGPAGLPDSGVPRADVILRPDGSSLSSDDTAPPTDSGRRLDGLASVPDGIAQPADVGKRLDGPVAGPDSNGQADLRKRLDGPTTVPDGNTQPTDTAVALDGTTPSPDGNVQPGETYQVKGRYLYDPCGERVVVRGVEQMFWDTGWISSSFVSEIGKVGANTVRILPQITAPTPDGAGVESLAETERLIQLAIENKMLVDVAIDGGKSVDVYLRNDVKALLLKYEKQIVIHAKGESEEASEDAWAAAAKKAVSQMRAAGYKAPIYLLPTGYGRMLTDLLHKGEEIVAADPQKNIVFGWQAYWGGSNFWQKENGMTLSEGMAKVRDAPFPIQVGLEWHTDADVDPNEVMDYSSAMADAQAYGIGWLWWDWRMSTDNLTTDGTYGHWADVGKEIASSNANSISKTSVRTYFQQNGVCRAGTGVTVPDPPTNLAAAPGNGQATITFAPPANNGGAAIDNYRVTCNPGAITAVGSTGPITVNGLSNGTTYTVTAAAHNSAGWSAESSPSASVMPQGSGPGKQSAVKLTPIDGGPTYYADHGFTRATAWGAKLGYQGFDDPTFFPIAVWMDCAVEDSTFARLLDLNVNGIVATCGNNRHDLMRNHGLWGIPSAPTASGWGLDADNPSTPGAESVGLLTMDEPYSKAMFDEVAAIRAATPVAEKSGRFFYTNYTDSLLNGDIDYAYYPEDMVAAQDICSADLYAMTDFLYAPWKVGQKLYDTDRDATPDDRRRGSNYGSQVDSIRKAYPATARAPIGVFTENGGPLNEDILADMITPAEMTSALWSQLVHGARMLLYFNHTFGDIPDYDGNDNWANPSYTASGIYAATKTFNGRVRSIAKYLNSPFDGYVVYGDRGRVTLAGFLRDVSPAPDVYSGIDASCHWFADEARHYILASTRESGSRTNIQATLSLTDGYQGTAHELFENRDIPIVGGTFTDTFATGHAYHVYRID